MCMVTKVIFLDTDGRLIAQLLELDDRCFQFGE